MEEIKAHIPTSRERIASKLGHFIADVTAKGPCFTGYQWESFKQWADYGITYVDIAKAYGIACKEYDRPNITQVTRIVNKMIKDEHREPAPLPVLERYEINNIEYELTISGSASDLLGFLDNAGISLEPKRK